MHWKEIRLNCHTKLYSVISICLKETFKNLKGYVMNNILDHIKRAEERPHRVAQDGVPRRADRWNQGEKRQGEGGKAPVWGQRQRQ